MSVLFYTDPFTKGPALYGTQAPGSDTISLDGAAAGTYYLRVYGYIAGNYTLAIIPNVTSTAPNPPTDVQASSDQIDQITVTWDASAGASSCQVWRSTTNDSTTATLLADNVTGTTYSDTTAQTGTTYYFWVKAANAVGTSDFMLSAAGSLGTGGGTISEVEPNNSYTDPQNLGTVDRQINLTGSLATANDVDWYTFTLDMPPARRGCN